MSVVYVASDGENVASDDSSAGATSSSDRAFLEDEGRGGLKTHAHVGLPPGWTAVNKIYKSGESKGETYIRYQGGKFGKTVNKVKDAIIQNAKEINIDPDEEVEKYQKLLDEKEKQREEAISLFREQCGKLTPAIVSAMPGWQCEPRQVMYRFIEASGERYKSLDDIEERFGQDIFAGIDIPDIQQARRQGCTHKEILGRFCSTAPIKTEAVGSQGSSEAHPQTGDSFMSFTSQSEAEAVGEIRPDVVQAADEFRSLEAGRIRACLPDAQDKFRAKQAARLESAQQAHDAKVQDICNCGQVVKGQSAQESRDPAGLMSSGIDDVAALTDSLQALRDPNTHSDIEELDDLMASFEHVSKGLHQLRTDMVAKFKADEERLQSLKVNILSEQSGVANSAFEKLMTYWKHKRPEELQGAREYLQSRLEDLKAEEDKVKALPSTSPSVAKTQEELRSVEQELEETSRLGEEANAQIQRLEAIENRLKTFRPSEMPEPPPQKKGRFSFWPF